MNWELILLSEDFLLHTRFLCDHNDSGFRSKYYQEKFAYCKHIDNNYEIGFNAKLVGHYECSHSEK